MGRGFYSDFLAADLLYLFNYCHFISTYADAGYTLDTNSANTTKEFQYNHSQRWHVLWSHKSLVNVLTEIVIVWRLVLCYIHVMLHICYVTYMLCYINVMYMLCYICVIYMLCYIDYMLCHVHVMLCTCYVTYMLCYVHVMLCTCYVWRFLFTAVLSIN